MRPAITKTAFALLLLFAAFPVCAQEVFVHYGLTHETGPSDNSFAYALGYLGGLGEHAAWSLTYLNEGHVTNHKRDGFALQFWGRENVIGRRLSLAVGIGPYFYYDTHIHESSAGEHFHDHHGLGGMASASATYYLGGRLFVQARGNWIETPHSSTTLTVTGGLGYQLDAPNTPGPLTGSSRPGPLTNRNELTVMAGRTTFNSINDNDALAGTIEYRRRLGPYFDWTIGWLDERHPVDRTGPATELWAGRSFFHDNLRLGVGFGPYLAYDRSGDHNVTKVAYLASVTGSIRFASHWAGRFTFHRVTTTAADRDTDVFLVGLGYLF